MKKRSEKIKERIKRRSTQIKRKSKKIKQRSKTLKYDTLSFFKEHRLFILGLLIFLSLLLYSYSTGGIIFKLFSADVDSAVLFLGSFGKLALFLFFILTIIEVVVAPMPSLVLNSAGGLAFGGFVGGLTALVGNTTGSVIAFLIAKKYGEKYFRQSINKKHLERLDRYSKRYGGYALFILRVNPFTSTDVLSYVAGFTKIPLRHFIIATFFGLSPLVFAQTYLGYSIIRSSDLLFTIFLIVTLIYIILFIYGIYLSRKNSKRK